MRGGSTLTPLVLTAITDQASLYHSCRTFRQPELEQQGPVAGRVQEVAARQRSWLCGWLGAAPPKVGALEAAAAAGAAAAEVEAVALDLGHAFLHAFIIPNYKARARLR